MNKRIVSVLAVALGLASAPSAATAQQRTTETDRVVLGSCAPGDDLVADFTIRQMFGSTATDSTIHLHLTGTIQRTGTGVTGRYAETQLDRFGSDGSQFYAGNLSHLVIQGRRTILAAGHATASDAGISFTPGLQSPLLGDAFVATVCSALL